MINEIFRLCVVLLTVLAHRLGTTYETVNVWIFVVIWPVITIALLLVVGRLTWRVRHLTRQLDATR